MGDRFVFQSEVLFAPGQASINPEGQAQLGQIADAIMQIIADIPSDIPWILQVEGHTDDIPVSGLHRQLGFIHGTGIIRCPLYG